MLRSCSDPDAVPLYNRRAIQGVPPLTGDGSQFDAHLDHTDPSPLFDDRHTPVPSAAPFEGRALVVIAALVVGLFAGFAGGYFVGQEGDPIPSPRSAAQAVPVPTTAVQPQTYTDAPVSDPIPESQEQPASAIASQPRESSQNVPRASTTQRDPNVMRRGPLRSADTGSLQIASRPTGAQVFVDDVRVGVTPMSLAEVSVGSHRVRIELPGFRRWATAVNVESGARARVGASLER